MKFKVGDRVKALGKWDATVMDTYEDRVDIHFDDEPVYPDGDWWDESELELIK